MLDIHRNFFFFLYIPLQSAKCGKRNICVVNCMHLIYLDDDEDASGFMMVLDNVSNPCKVLCAGLRMLLV